MPISVVFDPPLPSDSPSTFNTKAFTLLGDLNDWSTQANALPGEVATNLTTLLASPPAIGGTTPAAGSFTTLSASGAIKSTGANLVNEASAVKLSQESASASYVTAYGADASTQGSFFVVTKSSNGSVSAVPATFSSTGLAVTGALSSSDTVSIVNNSATTRKLSFYSTGNGLSENANIRVNNDGATTNSGVMYFATRIAGGALTDNMTLDSSGNLGLGVTPSAWSGIKAIEFSYGSFSSSTSLGTEVDGNCYYNGANWIYRIDGTAFRYNQAAAGHSWFTAPSGTAGNPISFTQAMTLDANGDWMLGKTASGSVGVGMVIYKTGALQSSVTGTGSNYHAIFSNNDGYVAVGSITSTGSTTTYATSSDYRLKNITGPITNSGAYIDSLNPVEGTWKADGSTFVGLIAHEVQEVSRTPVATGTKDGEQMQAMDYSSSEIIANLIAEVKSLRQRVAQLEG